MKKLKGLLFVFLGVLLVALASCGKKASNSVYELNKTSLELNIGDTFKLELSVDGIVVLDGISWTSADSKIAIVNNGEVKATGSGATTISASYESIKLDCNVTVLAKDNINLSQNEILLEVGNTLELKLLNNGNPISEGVTWMSTDTSIATVENGVVKALVEGEVIIKAIYENKAYVCNVVVMKKFTPEGSYVAERVVEEMGGVKFIFDLKINEDGSYNYSRRTTVFEGDTFEGGVVSTGKWSYSNGSLILTHDKGRMEFRVNNQDQISSVGKIDTGRVESELTFKRAN